VDLALMLLKKMWRTVFYLFYLFSLFRGISGYLHAPRYSVIVKTFIPKRTKMKIFNTKIENYRYKV